MEIRKHSIFKIRISREKNVPNTYIYKACKEVKMLHLETLKELNSNKFLSISGQLYIAKENYKTYIPNLGHRTTV
jgi:hypothetical protein